MMKFIVWVLGVTAALYALAYFGPRFIFCLDRPAKKVRR